MKNQNQQIGREGGKNANPKGHTPDLAESSQRSWANIMLIVYLLMARGHEGNEDVMAK